MSVFLDISAALDYQLSIMAGLPPVAWENKTYDPVIGTLYVRPTLLPGETTQATLGAQGEDQNIGIYQVDVFAPAGTGKNAAIVMADTIANHFKRGSDLVYNGRTVRIRNVSRLVGTNNADGWYQIPIEILYISFTTARV